MAARQIYDFTVKYDPEKDTQEELSRKIIYCLVNKRLKYHKPVVWFIGGDSGEGKSYTALKLIQIILDMQGIKLLDYMDLVNIYTPLQYTQKLDQILHNKIYKKVNVVCMHEAREIVKAQLWYSFLNQTISDINAMSRSLKRLCIVIISQFIRDISSNIRYTITYYSTVFRPLGSPPQLHIYRLWKDDRDIEKPRLRKARLFGRLKYPNGKYKKFRPTYFEIKKPDKEIIDIFDRQDFESKGVIIKNKLNKLMKQIELDVGKESHKVDSMVEWYVSHQEQLILIGRMYRGNWKAYPHIKEMHGMSEFELDDFSKKLDMRLRKIGVIQEDEPSSHEFTNAEPLDELNDKFLNQSYDDYEKKEKTEVKNG